MKIYSWNVNGIRAVQRKGVFEPFLREHQPDILCLQETKASRDQLDELFGKQPPSVSHLDAMQGVTEAQSEPYTQYGERALEVTTKQSAKSNASATSSAGWQGIALRQLGYEEYWNSAEKKGYSGTAIFSKIKPIAIINGMPQAILKEYNLVADSYGDPNKEGRVITAEYDKFYVVTVYTPNAKDDLSRISLRHKQWDPAFLAYCKQLEKKKPVVFCGDLNVAHTELDLANPKPNVGKKGFTTEERNGFQNFIDAGFVDTLRLFKAGNGYYTWWSHFANARARNVGWRIDYFLVSNSLKNSIKSAEIHANVLGSDHCPISIELEV